MPPSLAAVLIIPLACLLLAAHAHAALPPIVLHLAPGARQLLPAGVPAIAETVPDADRAPDAGLALTPSAPCRWVVSPREPLTLTATVAPADPREDARLTCWDWNLRPVAQAQLGNGATQVTLAVAGRGTYLVTLDRLRAGTCVARLARSFAVCPDNAAKRHAWAESGFWVGQCSFPGWQNAVLAGGHTAHPDDLTDQQSWELDAELVARMGVQVARINYVVTRRDDAGLDLDFSLADACAKAFTARGLKLDVQLFAPQGQGRGPVLPAYADAPLEWALLCPLQELPYRHFVREMARRHGPSARFFQIGNEPGNPQQSHCTSAEFVASVRQAADELRRQFPRTPVTNGGYCFDNEPVQEIIRDLRGVTDFASYHCHDTLAGLARFRASFVALHQKAGYKPLRLANTEMGLAMPTLASERTQAVHELQKLLYCWAHGDEGVLLYSSRELWWPRQFSYNGISDYGFVDHFFCPRFAYGAMSALLDHYAGFRFERVLTETDRLHAYLFAAGPRRLVSLFAPQGHTRVRLQSDATAASMLDAMGNSKPLRAPHQVTLTARDYPTTVLLEGPADVQVEVLPER